MDRFSGLTAFVRAAELGSFATAGRSLGLSASAVGKAVARLEEHLGVRLFQRSTRSLRLTEEGRLFHERCRRVLDDLDDAHSAVSRSRAAPQGTLRVSAPVVGYHLLMPLLLDFTALYPEVELDLDFNDRIVDLIGEGIDVAIRSGDLPDSGLMSRVLCPFQLLLCAAPDYLARFGTPGHPADLALHRAIRFRFPNSGKVQDWPLRLPAGIDLRLRASLICNNMEAVRSAALGGLGIGCMPDFLVREPLAAGSLRTVLDSCLEGGGTFRMLWPSSRHLSPKVRAFVGFLSDSFGADGAAAGGRGL